MILVAFPGSLNLLRTKQQPTPHSLKVLDSSNDPPTEHLAMVSQQDGYDIVIINHLPLLCTSAYKNWQIASFFSSKTNRTAMLQKGSKVSLRG